MLFARFQNHKHCLGYYIIFTTTTTTNNNNNNNNNNLGRRLSEFSGDVQEVQFLYQPISVAVQRFNAVLLAARQFF